MSQFDIARDKTMIESTPTRRVRDEVKDKVAVAAASVAASVVLVLLATVLMKLTG